MNYFVTGATGFIGRHLVAELLKREGTIYALVREGSRGKLDALVQRLGAEEGRIVPVTGDLSKPGLGVEGFDEKVDHLFHLAAVYDVEADEEASERANVEGTKHVDRVRERSRRGALPPHQLDRRGRQLQGRVPGGHVRRGAEAAPPLPPHEVRVGAARARGRGGEHARLPARHRRRPFGDRRDGQDRRPLLLLQAAPEAAPRAAGVVPARRPGGRADEHRAGRLRRARDGPHRPPAGRRAARATPSIS